MRNKMYGMKYPKIPKKKKRRPHPKPIVSTEKGQCYLCRILYGDKTPKHTEEHHVLYGSGQRAVSEANGLKVDLCPEHHRIGPDAVHNNRSMREFLCQIFQEEYEKTHSREEWMQIAKKNYLEEP